MSSRCIQSSSNHTNELVAEWNQYTYAIQEYLNNIETLCKDPDSLTPKLLQTFIIRLQENLDKIQKTFEKVNTKINPDTVKICGYPRKKFRAVAITTIGTSGLIFGLASLGISQLGDATSVNNSVKWTGYAFCLAGAVLKKAGDFLWNNWGNDESDQKMLLELKARASIISNTETTIHILSNLIQTMERSDSFSTKRPRRKTPQKIITGISHQRNVSEGSEVSFEPLMSTLRTYAETRKYRLSRIFNAPLNFNPFGTTRLNRSHSLKPEKQEETSTSLQSPVTLVMQESTSPLNNSEFETTSSSLNREKTEQTEVIVTIPEQLET